MTTEQAAEVIKLLHDLVVIGWAAVIILGAIMATGK